MEPILGVTETLSGEDVIADLCERIADELRDDCCLRGSDGYTGYSAKVVIEIQLLDIDTQSVKRTIAFGKPIPGQPSHQIVLDVPLVEIETDGSGLERQADGSEPVRPKRFYTPRNAKPRTPADELIADPSKCFE
jgi:hypothetical protein